MENEQQIFDQIDRYLNNQLSEEATAKFEAEVEGDADLREKLKLQVKARYATQIHQKTHRRAFFADQNTDQENTVVRPLFPKKYLSLAAVITTLIAVAGLLYFLLQPQPTAPELYAMYFEEVPMKTLRSGPSDTQDSIPTSVATWYAALSDFQHGDYEKTVNAVLPLLEDSTFTFRNQAHLCLGLSYLKLNRPQDAVTQFQKIDKDNPSMKYDAIWYEAMAYLKQEDKENTIVALSQLGESREYSQKAANLINILQ